MKDCSRHKYPVSSERDRRWGITVCAAGKKEVPAGYDVYPPREGHPDGFAFDVDKGRILDSYQLVYIVAGRGRYYFSPREWTPVAAGDMMLLRPHLWHSYCPDRHTGWSEYWIGFNGTSVDNRFAKGFFDAGKALYRVGVRDDMVSLYEKAIDIAQDERSAYQQYLAGVADMLLGMTIYYDRNRHFAAGDTVERIDRARALMRQRAAEGISPEQVAREVNMSYSWFRKMFRDYTNVSPARYMQELRLQQARTMLVATSMSVKEIAYALNFDDLSYFSNMFRRRTGMTPITYRKTFGTS